MIYFKDKTIIITGGTQGIGLAIAMAFAQYGGKCLLTYHFGSADEEEIIKKFSAHNYPLPELYQANVSDPADTENLFQLLQEKEEKIDVYVCNVAVAKMIVSFEDYSLSALKKTLSYSAWTLFSYTNEIYKRFGRYPRYVIGIFSTGPDHYSYGYDYVATAKKVMEVMCCYMSYHLRHEQVSLNIIRPSAVKTESFEKIFGKEFVAFSQNFVPDQYWIEA
ncbi:MAG: SDR family oxidoreductase [Legionella sp.]